jgi:phosphatidylserine/phosphatidylglycerophosphate/cardiolipin synthase-like enzyme
MLRTAKVSVDVAMYSFTDRELAEELVALAHSGVKVRVIVTRVSSMRRVNTACRRRPCCSQAALRFELRALAT